MSIKRASATALFAVISAFAVFAQNPVLSLDQCLSIALDKNPTVRVADMEVERMDYSKKDVLGQLLPAVDFGANYSRMLAKQVMYMNMDAFGGAAGGDDAAADENSSRNNGIKMGLDNSWSLGFNASLPVIAPQLWKSLSISDAQILRSLEASRQSKQALVNQVKSAYYALLLANDSKEVIKQSYDMAAFTYETYSKQYSLGAASDYDVLRTSVAVKNIEPQLMQADIAIKQARLQLLILMGLDANFEFEPATSLREYEKEMYGTTLALTNDYSMNADLKLMDIDTDILDKTVSMRKLSFLPTLALSANYNWTAMNNGNPFSNLRWNPYSTVGVSLSFPIYQGGRRWSQLKQAQVQAAEMRLQRDNLERSVAMQVDLAVDNIKMNVKQIASCSESVKEAERAHNIMEQSFNIGAASYLELRDSELALTQARLTYYQAIYNYLIANSELELLQGNAPVEKYSNNK